MQKEAITDAIRRRPAWYPAAALIASLVVAATMFACRTGALGSPGAGGGPSGHNPLKLSTAPATRAILHPTVISSQAAASIPADERVVGVVIDHTARAYPLSILDRHQVVDDTIGGRALAVTFCPLTQSAVVFDRALDGKAMVFEASDELYQSSLLLNDQATHSLWSQIEGAAIEGPMAGKRLAVLPSIVTQWGLWKHFHPDSGILRDDGADGTPDPFAGYEKSADPAFPVSHLDGRLPAKMMVVGIHSQDESRAFPFSSLAEMQGELPVKVGKSLFDVIYDKKTQTAGVASNGKHIPAYTGYWFAWAAFHPKSEIWGEPVPHFPPAPDTFHPGAAMSVPREGMSATTLKNGEVLVAGGDSGGKQMLATAELYNPVTNKWSATGSLNIARGGQTATLLPDGTVLIAGGLVADGQPTAAAEIYDPKTGRFTRVGNMVFARGGHTATLLQDGKVLIAGGYGTKGMVRTAELYNPATRGFTATGKLTVGREFSTATLMRDGRVLIAGGGDHANAALASAEIYDPKTGRFSLTDYMMAPRTEHAAALLPDGRVLVAGGDNSEGSLRSAEIYDPVTGKFRPTLSLLIPREGPAMVDLPDGRVLVVGGSMWLKHRRVYLRDAEIYDPKAGRFVLAGKMSVGRYRPLAVLLPGNKVMVAGSFASPGFRPTAAIDIYSPAAAATVASAAGAQAGAAK